MSTPEPSSTLEPLLRELLGQALRRRRRAHGRTLADVAGQAGVSMQHLSDVERGRKDPSSEILAAICGALDLGVAELLADATETRRGEDRTGDARPAAVLPRGARPPASARPLQVLDLTGPASALPGPVLPGPRGVAVHGAPAGGVMLEAA